MRKMENILTAIDFSSYSKVALEQAKRIARWNQSDLHLIHVIDKYVLEELHKTMGRPEKEIEDEVLQCTNEKVQLLFENDPLELRQQSHTTDNNIDDRRSANQRLIELKPDIVVGDPFQCIRRKINEVNADLLVLGSNGATSPKYGLGKLATKCVRKAVSRVLIVRGDQAKPFTNVLAAISFSSCAGNIVQQAIKVAQYEKAKLRLIHSYVPPWTKLHYRSPTAACAPDFKTQFIENITLELKSYLKDYQSELKPLDVQCELVESIRPADGVIEYAQQAGSDLIVLGTHGRRGMTSHILGTQAERILQNSTASALILRPADFNPTD